VSGQNTRHDRSLAHLPRGVPGGDHPTSCKHYPFHGAPELAKRNKVANQHGNCLQYTNFKPCSKYSQLRSQLKIKLLFYALNKLAHMAWSHAAALLEDLARIGLTTSSAIERAYRKDTKLLWRLVACFVRVNDHIRNIRGRLAQVVSYCEYFRPYFKRWRVCIMDYSVCIAF
jgi:hypothetical protein